MKTLLGFLILFPVTVILLLGFLGFVPVLSNFIGPKPKDLGIKYSQAAYDSGYRKSSVKVEAITKPVSPKESIATIGSHPVKDSFTSEEVTAAAQNRNWIYWPFNQIQVRFNQDGTGEASGLINITKIFPYLSSLGVSAADVEKAMAKFNLPKTNLVFYIKVSGSVKDNQVDCKISRFEIGRIPIPMNYITQYTPAVNNFLEKNVLGNRPGYNIKSMTIADGKLLYDGTLPDIEALVPAEK